MEELRRANVEAEAVVEPVEALRLLRRGFCERVIALVTGAGTPFRGDTGDGGCEGGAADVAVVVGMSALQCLTRVLDASNLADAMPFAVEGGVMEFAVSRFEAAATRQVSICLVSVMASPCPAPFPKKCGICFAAAMARYCIDGNHPITFIISTDLPQAALRLMRILAYSDGPHGAACAELGVTSLLELLSKLLSEQKSCSPQSAQAGLLEATLDALADLCRTSPHAEEALARCAVFSLIASFPTRGFLAGGSWADAGEAFARLVSIAAAAAAASAPAPPRHKDGTPGLPQQPSESSGAASASQQPFPAAAAPPPAELHRQQWVAASAHDIRTVRASLLAIVSEGNAPGARTAAAEALVRRSADIFQLRNLQV